MEVKMKTIMAGPAGTYNPGEIVEFDKDEAIPLIKGGYAVPLKGTTVETADIKPDETADVGRKEEKPKTEKKGKK